MSYYRIFGFEREPFSTSPDPDFLFLSREYDLALTNILIELRLRRGLSVILGDIGTGKTTLSRKLVKELSERGDFCFHVILNPTFESEKELLFSLVKNFQLSYPHTFADATVVDMRDSLEKFLLHKTLTENATVVLIIDEAQKLTSETLESLRILLNYETNEFKLIQLILLGQLELYSKILQIPNFYDRIDFKFALNPLGLEETCDMIDFRVRQAGYHGAKTLFTKEAITDIFNAAKGYPRGIIRLCHKCLRELVLSKESTVIDHEIVSRVVEKDAELQWEKMAIQQSKSF